MDITEVTAVIYHALVYSTVGDFLVEELLFEQEGGPTEIIRVCNTAGETIKLSSVALSRLQVSDNFPNPEFFAIANMGGKHTQEVHCPPKSTVLENDISSAITARSHQAVKAQGASYLIPVPLFLTSCVFSSKHGFIQAGPPHSRNSLQVLFFHLYLISGSSIRIGIGSNYSNIYEQSILPCKKEELQCGDGLCLLNWLRCHYKKDCGRDYMSIKLTCSKVHLNQSSPTSEFPSYSENGSDTSLLVSPLLVAGVVIGLVLFLSCVTIIVGSLRKDGRLRHPHLRRDAVYAPDGFSYGGSFGELRSTCLEEFPPAFDFGSYLDTLSQVNVMYPDSPPRYDECVGPGATQIYIPTDDPPPYSLTDPCQRNELSVNISLEEEAASGTTGQAANYAVRLQDLQQPISSISLSSLTLEAAPLYETVVCEQNIPIPLVPMEVLKNSSTDYQTLLNQIM
ncbi:protein BEAN1 [Egretta garzetta]|nr:protein BEAN1 [Egretta garzetta]